MYSYEMMKPVLFSEEGLAMFTKIRDRVKMLLATSGAFTLGAAIRTMTGDTWTMVACIDHLKFTGEIREVTNSVFGQNRIFIEAS